MKKRVLTVPNLLSLLRLLMVPLFVWTYTVKRSDLATLLVLAVSAFTDLLDGWIARRFDMISDVGKLLDPIADKVTQGVMLICLTARFPMMRLPLALFIVKEALVGATHIMAMRRTGAVESAQMHGKVATCFLDGLALSHLLWGNMPVRASMALIAATSAAMLVSLAMYVSHYLRQVARAKDTGERV